MALLILTEISLSDNLVMVCSTQVVAVMVAQVET